MTSLRERAIGLFNQCARDTDDIHKIRSEIQRFRTSAIHKLEEQTPGKRDPELIEKLRVAEIASVFSQFSDPNHPNAVAAVKRAIEGFSSTGNPLQSRLFELQEKPADAPKDKFTVRVDHGMR